MNLSERGTAFIGRFEGFVATPYNDAAGHATIGFGHLIHYGPVTDGDRKVWGLITEEHALQLLRLDAEHAEAGVRRYITRPLSQCQFDALVSFAYNCGSGALAGSVGAAVNAGADPSAALEAWSHAGGRVLEGLLRRRQAESRLYRKGIYGDGQRAVPPVPPLTPLEARYLWAAWRLGEGEFRKYGKANMKVRPTALPKRIPASWLKWYRGFLRARGRAAGAA